MHGTLFKQLTVKQADHYSLPLVKQFYKKNGMRAQAPKGEKIYVEINKHIAEFDQMLNLPGAQITKGALRFSEDFHLFIF